MKNCVFSEFSGVARKSSNNMRVLEVLLILPIACYSLSIHQLYDLCSLTTHHHQHKGLLTLDCTDKGFSTIPKNIPKNADKIQVLVLALNHIKTIKKGSLTGFPNLQYLDLSSNGIKNIADGAFIGLTQLKTLNLEGNFLNKITKGTIEGLENLASLDISYNDIDCQYFPNELVLLTNKVDPSKGGLILGNGVKTDIICNSYNLNYMLNSPQGDDFYGPTTFTRCRRYWTKIGSLTLDCSALYFDSVPKDVPHDAEEFRELILSGNQIKRIPPGALDAFKNVVFLYLVDNNLETIERGAFNNLPLKGLELEGNEIKHISPGAFRGLISTLLVNLRNNKLRSISKEVLDGLTEVLHLRLEENNIRRLERDTFEHNRELILLDVSYNQLEYVDENIFQHLKKIRSVYLSHQRSQGKLDFTLETFHGYVDVEVHSTWPPRALDLSHNNLNCTCETMWLVDLVHDRRLPEGGKMPGLQYNNFTDAIQCNSRSIRDKNFFKEFHTKCAKPTYQNCRLYEAFHWVIDCSLRGFTSIPTDPPIDAAKYTTLNFYGNNITHVPADAFAAFKNVEVLTLLGNQIETIDTGAFRNLPKISHIGFSHNNIKQIKKGAFENFGHYATVDFKANKLEVIPDEIFGRNVSIQTLLFSRNFIKKINDNAFKNIINTMSTLTVRSNNLEFVPKAVSGLLGLESLDLSRNLIKAIKTEDFSGMQSLSNLLIRENKLVDVAVFTKRLYLNYLDLSGNQITNIKGAFTGLKSLQVLILDNNKIKSLTHDDLADIDQIGVLSLRDNDLSNVDKVFKEKYRLIELDLSGNKLTKINGAFSGLTYLTKLTLQSNWIKKIEESDFANLDLIDLDVSGNMLESIDVNAITSLKKLRHIKISGQKSKAKLHLPLEIFKNFIMGPFEKPHVAVSIDISRNDFQCDCQMNWLFYLVFKRALPNGQKIPAIVIPDSVRNVSCNSKDIRDKVYGQLGEKFMNNCSSSGKATWTNCRSLYDTNHKIWQLDCQNRKFSEIPKYPPSDAEKYTQLNLNFNNIEHIPRGIFAPFKNLKVLYMADNRISYIKRDTFRGVYRLQSINLDDNMLERIDDRAFKHLEDLRSLSLANQKSKKELQLSLSIFENFIDKPLDESWPYISIDVSHNDFDCTCKMHWLVYLIKKGVLPDGKGMKALVGHRHTDILCNGFDISGERFSYTFLSKCTLPNYNQCRRQKLGVRELKSLDCRSRGFTKIPEYPPEDIAEIYELRLDDNKITNIPPRSFIEFKNLSTLFITSNNIEKIFKDSFSGLDNLLHLFLDGNSIEDLSDGCFQRLKKLEALSLGHNPLVSIGEALTGLSNLEGLSLGNTWLREITDHSFAGTPNINMLSVKNTELTKISEKALGGLSRLVFLDMSNLRSQGKLTLTLNMFSYFISDRNPVYYAKIILKQNSFQCTCEMKWLVYLFKHGMLPDGRKMEPMREKFTQNIRCGYHDIRDEGFVSDFLTHCS